MTNGSQQTDPAGIFTGELNSLLQLDYLPYAVFVASIYPTGLATR